MACNILDRVIAATSDSQECLSSQEVFYRLEEAEERIGKEGKEVVYGSMDAIGLYPSIRIKEAAKEAGKTVVTSRVKFAGVNYEETGMYVALT